LFFIKVARALFAMRVMNGTVFLISERDDACT